jgi:hypothetical protein
MSAVFIVSQYGVGRPGREGKRQSITYLVNILAVNDTGLQSELVHDDGYLMRFSEVWLGRGDGSRT